MKLLEFIHTEQLNMMYDDDNWWKGLKWKKDVFGCILRHIWKWFRGEKYDDESGLHHLAHAAWNCITLMEICDSWSR